MTGYIDDSALGQPVTVKAPAERHVYHDHRRIAKVTCLLLGIWMVIRLLELSNHLSGFLAFYDLTSDSPTVTITDFEALYERIDFLSVANLMVNLTIAAFFLRWSYLAANNAHYFCSVRLKYSKDAAVWWWFVPIASVWKPFLAMAEVWNASTGDIKSISDDPEMPKMVFWWWMAFAITAVSAIPLAVMLMNVLTPADGTKLYALHMIVDGVSLAWGFTAYLVVKGLTEIQHTQHSGESPPISMPN